MKKIAYFSVFFLFSVYADKITLDENTSVASMQQFQGSGLSSYVNGHGLFWNFQSGGYVDVGVNHTLYLVGLHIKDFGHKPNYGYFSIDPTATVVIQNSIIELSGDYVHDQGSIIFKGDHCRIIPHDYTFTTTESAKFYVDGATLTYNSLDGQEKNPFLFTDQTNQKLLLNGGNIRSQTAIQSLNLYSTTPTIKRNIDLSEECTINIKNLTPENPKNVTLDFSGQVVFFPDNGSNLINLDSNVKLKLENIVLFEYNPKLISFGDANSTLEFGNHTKIRLFEDFTISSDDKAWNFVGNSEIIGSDSTLVLDGSQKITVGQSSSLTLKSLRIIVKNADSLKALDDNSKIIFENSVLIFEGIGFEWSLGNIEVKGDLRLIGGDPTTIDAYAPFIFSSTGFLTIQTNSRLIVERFVEFIYKADPSNDGGLLFAQKRHIKLADPTSTLELNGCILHSTTTGIALDYGQLVIEDKVIFFIDGNVIEKNEAEIGSGVSLFVRPAAIFDIRGHYSYRFTQL